MRINVYISSSGLCSRREADRLVESKRVTINGDLAETGMNVLNSDEVMVDGKLVFHNEGTVYLLYHKPVGIETTTDTTKPKNIIDAVGYKDRIFPVGRLDKESSGLIILTSDGQIVNQILRSENAHEKEYVVKVDKTLTDDFLESMAKGVKIFNPVKHEYTITLPSIVKQLSSNIFSIILTQGLNLQIRRMVSALGYHVLSLERIRIMNLSIQDIPVGKWRHFTKDELSILNEKIHNN
ncbi:MAG: pseudouridine synthase [Candidatus Izemoplasmatales bacterium]|nr:pseudouridine synthase [Candidatus Izemoplasmatales bacterium]